MSRALLGVLGCCAWRRRRLGGRPAGKFAQERAGLHPGSSTSEAHAADDELNDAGAGAWTVRLHLGGEEHSLQLPLSYASSQAELKQALVEAALARLGPGGVPPDWLEGYHQSMRVTYLDGHGRPQEVGAGTSFRAVCDSLGLRVSCRDEDGAA